MNALEFMLLFFICSVCTVGLIHIICSLFCSSKANHVEGHENLPIPLDVHNSVDSGIHVL